MTTGLSNRATGASIAAMAASRGADLALLLLGGFQVMVDEVVVGLEEQGHAGVRPVHEFALRAIDSGADNAAELARQLSVSRQAAAKTIAALEEMGYVERQPDESDGRRKRLRVTARGHEMVATGARLFDVVRERWASQIGVRRLEAFEGQLAELVPERTTAGTDLLAGGDLIDEN
jgi:DNA-binding MarR family transcriptional regulator